MAEKHIDPFADTALWQRESRVRAWEVYEKQFVASCAEMGHRIVFKHPRPPLSVFLSAPHYYIRTYRDDEKSDYIAAYESACLSDRKSLMLVERVIQKGVVPSDFTITIIHDEQDHEGRLHIEENPTHQSVIGLTSPYNMGIYDTATVDDVAQYVCSVIQRGDYERERLQGMRAKHTLEVSAFFEPFILEVADNLPQGRVREVQQKVQKALADVFKKDTRVLQGFSLSIQEKTPDGGPIMRNVQNRNIRGEIIVGLDTDIVAMRQVFGKYKKAQKFSQFS